MPRAVFTAVDGIVEAGAVLGDLTGYALGLPFDGFAGTRQVAETLAKHNDGTIRPEMTQVELRNLAEEAHQARRQLGEEYKDLTPGPLRDYIYEINEQRYGDKLGPTFEYLVNELQKSYLDIIKSASRPNPDIDKLLLGFTEWLKRQPDSYVERYASWLDGDKL